MDSWKKKKLAKRFLWTESGHEVSSKISDFYTTENERMSRKKEPFELNIFQPLIFRGHSLVFAGVSISWSPSSFNNSRES